MSRDEIKLTALRDAAATAEGILTALLMGMQEAKPWTLNSPAGKEFLKEKLQQCQTALENARSL